MTIRFLFCSPKETGAPLLTCGHFRFVSWTSDYWEAAGDWDAEECTTSQSHRGDRRLNSSLQNPGLSASKEHSGRGLPNQPGASDKVSCKRDSRASWRSSKKRKGIASRSVRPDWAQRSCSYNRRIVNSSVGDARSFMTKIQCFPFFKALYSLQNTYKYFFFLCLSERLTWQEHYQK